MAAQGAMVAKVTGCDRRLGTLGGGGAGGWVLLQEQSWSLAQLPEGQ